MKRLSKIFPLFILLIWCGFPFMVLSQVKISDWVVRTGTKAWDVVNDVAVDTLGSIYITGSNGDTTLPSSISSIKTKSIRHQYLEKFDTAGNLIWHKTVLSSPDGYGSLLAVTQNNLVILAGSTIQQQNSEATSKNKTLAFFLTCLSPDGDPLWSRTFEGTKLDYLTSLSINPLDQSIQLSGYFHDTLKIANEIISSSHRADALLLNFTASGQFLSMLQFQGPGEVRINAVAYDYCGNSYLSGTFQNSMQMSEDISLDHENPAEDVAFFTQFSGNGQIEQATKICNGKGVKIQALKANDRGFFIAGTFGNKLTVGKTKLVSVGNDDIFLIFLDEELNCQWAKQIGSPKKDRLTDIELKNENVILTGACTSPAHIDNIVVSPPDKGNNIFVVSFDISGSVSWTKTFGGPSDDYPKGMDITPKGDIFLAGSFKNSLKLAEKNISSQSEEDIFIARIEDCDENRPEFKEPETYCEDGLLVLDAGDGFESYLWNNGLSNQQTLFVENPGDYSLELISKGGCVLYDTIHVLEIENPEIFIGNDTTITDTSILILSLPSGYASYQWNNGTKESVNVLKGLDYPVGINIVHAQVTNESGCIGEDDMILIITKSEEHHTFEDISSSCVVYPIPTDDKINLELKRAAEILNVKIYNQLGVELVNKSIEQHCIGSVHCFNLGPYPPGIYSFVITTDFGTAFKKIILY